MIPSADELPTSSQTIPLRKIILIGVLTVAFLSWFTLWVYTPITNFIANTLVCLSLPLFFMAGLLIHNKLVNVLNLSETEKKKDSEAGHLPTIGSFRKPLEKKEEFRMSQMQLMEYGTYLEVTGVLKAEGISLENDADKIAAMFAITNLGYYLPNNTQVIKNKQYEVSIDDNKQIVVRFPKGVLKP